MDNPRLTVEDRKIINRSGTKLCEICGNVEILVQHHLNGREIKDWNLEWNVCNICDNCHRLVHINTKDRIIIEGWFKTTHGRKLVWRYFNEESVTGQETHPKLN